MYQHHKLYTSCMFQLINYTPHVCANSSTTCLKYVPNMYLNHIPKTYTNITIKSYVTIHHSIHKPNTINPYIKPCSTTSLLCSLKLNQQLQQHITTKRPIPICQIPTKKYQMYHVRQHRYSNRGRTPLVTTHITRSKINTPMFSHGKTPMGKHPRPQPMRPLGAVY
jgi:hypothetical protein